jgi:hypothetical protein
VVVAVVVVLVLVMVLVVAAAVVAVVTVVAVTVVVVVVVAVAVVVVVGWGGGGGGRRRWVVVVVVVVMRGNETDHRLKARTGDEIGEWQNYSVQCNCQHTMAVASDGLSVLPSMPRTPAQADRPSAVLTPVAISVAPR